MFFHKQFVLLFKPTSCFAPPPWDPIHPCAAVPSNENAAFPRTLTLAAGTKRSQLTVETSREHRYTVRQSNTFKRMWIATNIVTRYIFLLFLLILPRFGTTLD